MTYDLYMNGNGVRYLVGFHKKFNEYEVITMGPKGEGNYSTTVGFKSMEEVQNHMGITTKRVEA